MDSRLKKAEECVKKNNINLGTWYVVEATSEYKQLNGVYLATPNSQGDGMILINVEDGSSHFVHLTKFIDLKIIGVVREGKASEEIWV